MKQFNLEEYLANPSRRVVTRDGRNVRIICTNAKCKYPIIALVEKYDKDAEDTILYTKNGTHHHLEWMESKNDLFFVPEKHEGWANIYNKRNRCLGDPIFSSKEKAEIHGKNFSDYITTIKIEWEE